MFVHTTKYKSMRYHLLQVQDGKPTARTLANISHWPPNRIEALRRVLRGDFDRGPREVDYVCSRSSQSEVAAGDPSPRELSREGQG